MSNTRPSLLPGLDWLKFWQQYYNTAARTWTWGLGVQGQTALLQEVWDQYLGLARQSQEFARQLAQWVWQTGGIPGREEIGQVNRQVYELANRLDELEEGLTESLEANSVETKKLAAEITTLKRELGRLKDQIEQVTSISKN